jgi:hypothetical protein
MQETHTFPALAVQTPAVYRQDPIKSQPAIETLNKVFSVPSCFTNPGPLSPWRLCLMKYGVSVSAITFT